MIALDPSGGSEKSQSRRDYLKVTLL
jgi:hypothetical protein